jgi:CubicO group peptidase (beta-lactamase class C family)
VETYCLFTTKMKNVLTKRITKNVVFLAILLTSQIFLYAQSKEDKVDELLTTYSANNTFNGTALVYYKGNIILNRGYGLRNIDNSTTNDQNTIFQIGSITKQFTAAIILKLQEDKKLSINDKISKYFPNFPNGENITIQHLLTHTAGIYNYTDNGEFMQSELEKSQTKAQMMALFEQKPLDFPPGTAMKYSNSGYLLLGYIIELVTREKFEEIVKKWIFEPLKMNDSGFDFRNLKKRNKAVGYSNLIDNKGNPTIVVDQSISFSGGAIYSTADDLLKWHLGLKNNIILKRKSLEQAFTPYKNNFGYGWVIDDFYGKKGVFHNGSIPGFTSNIYRIEADNTCIILLNNIGNRNIDTITKNILNILYDKPFSYPVLKKEIALDKKKLSKYIGTYRFSENFLMNIFLKNKGVYAQRIGDSSAIQIFPYQENLFFVKDFEADLEFKVNSSGVIDTLILRQGGKDITAQKIESANAALYETILKMDQAFAEAFNNRNLEKLKAILSPDLEFYHDQTGLTNYNQNIQIFSDNFKSGKKMRRELIEESVEVYPIKGFGAIQIGTHNFYVTENGQEKLDSSPKFMHVWKQTGVSWQIVRVVSYAH